MTYITLCLFAKEAAVSKRHRAQRDIMKYICACDSLKVKFNIARWSIVYILSSPYNMAKSISRKRAM